MLQAGTENGCVVLFNTENDGLQYLKRFDTQESKFDSLFTLYQKTELKTGPK